MNKLDFAKGFQAYDRWRNKLCDTIEVYQNWLEMQDASTLESAVRLRDTLETLKSDHLTIAFVAEFSRGKTELINAIFFADYGRRLLPSSPGRTTMCPTQLFYDPTVDYAYVRLLPIETRLKDATIAELKSDRQHWVEHVLDLNSVEKMEKTFREVLQVKRVGVEEAARLGLAAQSPHAAPTANVEIPKWRHAMISFPHPLLRQGLNILDTPGLNALGSEPELTLSMLPSAQAVLFVLGADTGVTHSDLEIWQQQVRTLQQGHRKDVVVVLNKIDTLWDDLQTESGIQNAIETQRKDAARTLGIEPSSVFPASAQKALVAKVRKDPELLERSGLPELENYLSTDLIASKQRILLDTISNDIGQMLENSRRTVVAKIKGLQAQHEELVQLTGKSEDVIRNLLTQTRSEQAEHHRRLEAFRSSRKQLKHQAQALRSALDLMELDRAIDQARQRMKDSWTTHGLRSGMKSLFDTLRHSMQGIVQETEEVHRHIRAIYQEFQKNHGLDVPPPMLESTKEFQMDLEMLYQEAEAFRDSPVTTMTEQSFVIKRFFSALVERAREIFFAAHKDTDSWLQAALEPLQMQIKDQKDLMERRLDNLQKIHRSKSTLQARIEELDRQRTAMTKELTTLRVIYENLQPAAMDELPRARASG